MSTTHELSQEEIDIYRHAFEAFDTDKTASTGDITIEELAAVFRSLKQNPSEDELKDIINEVDTDRDGTISFSEFISMMTRKSSTTDVEAELRAAFAVFDSDNSGCIDAKELKSVMSSIGESLTDTEIDEMIKMADTDGDGKISYDEFITIIK